MLYGVRGSQADAGACVSTIDDSTTQVLSDDRIVRLTRFFVNTTKQWPATRRLRRRPRRAQRRLSDHIDNLSYLIEALDLRDITLVVHDWGSGLGFHWALLNPESVKGIAYMEAIVMPITWDDWPESARGIFQGFRSAKGEDLVLERNMFVEAVLPSSILRDMTDDEMAAYRAPFDTPDNRQPTLNWPRQIPIEGEPAHMVELVAAYGAFMAESEIHKLFVNADPGSILVGRQREFCRSWPNQAEVTVKGLHFLQEDSPREIGQAVAAWYAGL